jgi:hypothetical protein
MLVGILTWMTQYMLGWQYFLEPISPFDKLDLPLTLTSTLCSLITYVACDFVSSKVLAKRPLEMNEPELSNIA